MDSYWDYKPFSQQFIEKFHAPRSQAWSASACSAQRAPGHAHPVESEESEESDTENLIRIARIASWCPHVGSLLPTTRVKTC